MKDSRKISKIAEVMGPGLYTINTADLPEIGKNTMITFADDTAIVTSIKNPDIATQNVQRVLDEITKWLQRWRTKASATKFASHLYA